MAEKQKKTTLLAEFQKRRKEWVKVWGPGVAVVLLGFLIASFFIKPAPPKRIVIAAGGRTGMYFRFATQYAAYLKEQGIELEVRETAGSIENLAMLQDEASGVSIAIVQGGTAPKPAPESLQSIASLYFEPVWVFHRGAEPLTDLRQLAGKRIAVGAEGSGTRAIALQLLDDNGIVAGRSTEAATGLISRFETIGGEAAAEALRQGSIDAAFFVIGPEAPLVRDLLAAADVHLMDFARHEAYPHRYAYLSSVVLHEGVIDLQENLPPHDVHLLAPAANLVCRDDLHSALPQLFIEAASRAHGRGGLLTDPNVFPSLDYIELPVNDPARRYFKNGPGFLHRVLPFWLASFIERMWILLLPLVTLLFPLFKIGPPLYRWQIRSRIFRWYRVLRAIDRRLWSDDPDGSIEDDLAKLRRMEEELADVWVPWSYMEEFYHLRLHIKYIHERVEQRLGPAGGKESPAES